MLVVPLWGVLNCRFWSHLGCLELTVTIFAYSGIAYSTVHNEMHKKCPDSNQTEISLRNLFKLEPTPTMVSFSGLISILRQASPYFYIGYNYSTRNSDMLRLTHATKNWGKQRVCYHSLK